MSLSLKFFFAVSNYFTGKTNFQGQIHSKRIQKIRKSGNDKVFIENLSCFFSFSLKSFKYILQRNLLLSLYQNVFLNPEALLKERKQLNTMDMASKKMNFHFEEIEHCDIKFSCKPSYFEA